MLRHAIWIATCADPDDDKYISAALEGRAAFLVTGDRQLLPLREHEGICMVDQCAFPTTAIHERGLMSGAASDNAVGESLVLG